ncbi:uncharacterized protein LOC134428798 [Melospiza melodia melodia]|uniref:uncharacterized protein LOC134428798 n=1 Tax=Melospiza melodia melodia TaxID=1914991 RepID=UPI002FD4CFCA
MKVPLGTAGGEPQGGRAQGGCRALACPPGRLPLPPLSLGSSLCFLPAVPLVERPKTAKRGESRPDSPKAEGKEKDEAASSDVGDSDTAQSDTAQSRAQAATAQRGVGQKDTRQRGDTGRTDTEQKDAGRGPRSSGRGRMDVGQDETGQSDMGQKDVGKSVKWRDRGGTDMGQEDMEQIKKEEMEMDIAEVEALPSSLDSPPAMTSTGQIKEEETKMGISKAPPHAQTKIADGTTSEMHPGAPGSSAPVQRVQSVRGVPGSQDLWVPSESVAGPSR